VPTIDLTAPRRAPRGPLDALPRRVGLTRRELELVGEAAGGAPLPFVPPPTAGRDALADRLGARPGAGHDDAVRALLDRLPDPRVSLERRGLLTDRGVDAALLGAVGLLATPSLALDLDVRVGRRHVAAWHRHDGRAVATLATADGVVFELAWFPVALWPQELARVAVLPEEHRPQSSVVPPVVDLPHELLDAAIEAVAEHRADLVPVLAAHHDGGVLDGRGRPVPTGVVGQLLGALARETQGRLRAVTARIPEPGSGEEVVTAGVAAWLLLADGWRELRPHVLDRQHRVEVRRVDHDDLAAALAPVLADLPGATR